MCLSLTFLAGTLTFKMLSSRYVAIHANELHTPRTVYRDGLMASLNTVEGYKPPLA